MAFTCWPVGFQTFSTSNRTKLLIFSLVFLFSSPLILLTTIYPHRQLIELIRLQTDQLSPVITFPSPRNNDDEHPKWLKISPVTFPSPSNAEPPKLLKISPVTFPSPSNAEPPKWLKIIQATHNIPLQRRLSVGLVKLKNLEWFHQTLNGVADTVTVNFQSVSPNVTWGHLFPEKIDEGNPQCPEIPMPKSGSYLGLDVLVAQLPCTDESANGSNGTKRRYKEGMRDVRTIQLSLAISHLIVENSKDNDVYAVFIGKCEPMLEIFRCNDLVWHEGDYRVYKPNVDKLKEALSQPVGSCALARPYVAQGNRQMQSKPNHWYERQATGHSNTNPKEAYVTALHSSESYVCGAITLAQSIRQTGSNKDLVLLADRTISSHSIAGLQAAGWKIKRIERIRSPTAKWDAYNVWNYSKLRVWQLTEYDKVIFIDSDILVLRNLDHLFHYPQLSAAPNDKSFFNSGIMILEPSECFFNILMSKRFEMTTYNGGDQGYLNEVSTWWHRLTDKINFMRYYNETTNDNRSVPEDQYTLHYLGRKPWVCHRDHDCNWDLKEYRIFASNEFSARWWQVYDAMSSELKPYCNVTEKANTKTSNRRKSPQKANLPDGHWKIKIKDPRQYKKFTVSRQRL